MSIQDLIAQFLKENNYPDTRTAFEREHGKLFGEPKEPLRAIIEDRYGFNEITDQLKNTTLDHVQNSDTKEIIETQISEWTMPSPQKPLLVSASVHGLVISSCLAHCNNTTLLFLSTANMKCFVLDLATNEVVAELNGVVGKVIVKGMASISDDKMVMLGMNGTLYLCQYHYKDTFCIETIALTQAHAKLITDMRVVHFNDKWYLFTLGWDFTLRVFAVGEKFTPITHYTLAAQGTSFDVTAYTGKLIVVLGKADITLLDVLTFEDNQLQLHYKISLNDAEFTLSSFSPRCISIQHLPDSVPLVAVATSHEPYMRLIVVSLKDIVNPPSPENFVPMMRNQILKNLSTLSPQDKYSQPLIAWRWLSGTKHNGVWIMGDDGVLRGIDLVLEQPIVQSPGHNGRIKSFAQLQDVLITTGVDKAIMRWV